MPSVAKAIVPASSTPSVVSTSASLGTTGNVTSASIQSLTLKGTLITATGADINTISNISALGVGTAQANRMVILDSNKSVTGITSLQTTSISGTNATFTNFSIANLVSDSITLDSVPITASALDINKLNGVTAGSAAASKFTLLDSNKNISGINTIGVNGISLGGEAVYATASEINKLNGVTAGTTSASKVLIVDGSKNLSGINSLGVTSLTLSGTQILATSSEINALKGITAGTASANKLVILDVNKDIVGINNLGVTSLTLGGTAITAIADEINTLTGVTAGTTSASKALIVDSDKKLVGLSSLGVASINLGGTIITSTATDLNKLAGVTAGTATASKVVILDSSKNITGLNSVTTTSLTLGSILLTSTATELNMLNGVTAGAASANKALVADGSKNLSGIGSLSLATINLGGTAVTASAADINKLSGITAGTALASKALIVDASKNIAGINSLSLASLTLGGTVISSTAAEINTLSGITVGTVSAGKIVTANVDKNIIGVNTLGVTNLSLGGTTVTATAAELNSLHGASIGVAGAGKVLLLDSSKDISGINILGVTSINLGGTAITATAEEINALHSAVFGTVSASSFLTTDADKNVTGLGTVTANTLNSTVLSSSSIVLGGTTVTATAAELNSLHGAAIGVAGAGKVLLLDASKDISGINVLGVASLSLGGTAVTASAADINKLSGLAVGTASAGKILTVDSNKDIVGINNLGLETITLGGVAITSTADDLNSIGGGTAGTATASKNLTVDANKDIVGINVLGAASLSLGGTAITASATDINKISGTTAGIVAASKMLMVDGSKNISGINSLGVTSLTLSGTAVTSSAADINTLAGVTAGVTSASKALIVDGSKNLSGIGSIGATSLTLGGTAITATAADINKLAGVTAGTTSASKALIVDGSKNISGINNLGLTILTLGGTAVSSTATEINTLAGVTAGTVLASKALIADISKNIAGINSITTASLTLGSTAITASATDINKIAGITAGTASASKAVILDTSSNISGINNLGLSTLTLGGTLITSTAADINNIGGITAGTATANKSLVVNSSKNISGINKLGLTTLTLGSTDVTSTAAEINVLHGITPGAATPSLALVLDNSGNIDGITGLTVQNLTLGGSVISSTGNELNYVHGLTAGVAMASKAIVLNSSKNISGINNFTSSRVTCTTLFVNGVQITEGGTGGGTTTSPYLLDVIPGTAVAGTALVLDDLLDIAGINSLSVTSLTVNGSSLGSSLGAITGVTAGTAVASKALILDASKNIAGINNITLDNPTNTAGTSSNIVFTGMSDVTPYTLGRIKFIQYSATSKHTDIELIGTYSGNDYTFLKLSKGGSSTFNCGSINFSGGSLTNVNAIELVVPIVTMSPSTVTNLLGFNYSGGGTSGTAFNSPVNTLDMNRTFISGTSSLGTGTKTYMAYIKLSYTELYTFYLTTAGTYHRLWINGKIVSQNWSSTTSATYTIPDQSFTANDFAHIYIDFYVTVGATIMHRLEWSSASRTRETIPTFYRADTMGIFRTPVSSSKYLRLYDPASTTLSQVEFSVTDNKLTLNADAINITANVPGSTIGKGWDGTFGAVTNSPNVRGCCWSPELRIFVAVTSTGTGNRVITSPDGVNWTARTSAYDSTWSSVCWSPELRLFVAVANDANPFSMSSPNGISWTINAIGVMGWKSICWSPALSLFVAVANSGTGNRAAVSANGKKWTNVAMPDNTVAYNAVCWSAQLGMFMTAVTTAYPAYSYDGYNWYKSPGMQLDTNIDITWSPELNLFVTVKSNGTSTGVNNSSDGMSWTGRTTDTLTFSTVKWLSEAGIFVIVANSGNSGYKVQTSPDGITWTGQITANNDIAWSTITYAPELSMCLILSSNGYRMTSTRSGLSCNFTDTSTLSNSAAYIANEACMRYQNGIHGSHAWGNKDKNNINSDLMKLTTIGLGIGTTNPEYKLEVVGTGKMTDLITKGSTTNNLFGNYFECILSASCDINNLLWVQELKMFIATTNQSSNGIITSSNGRTWTPRYTSTSDIVQLEWSPELKLLVAIRGGNFLKSSDGITWTSVTNTSNSWQSISWSPKLKIFTAIAVTGTVRLITSTDGTTWIDGTVPALSWNNIRWSPELEIYCISCSSSVDIYTSPDTITWTVATTLPGGNCKSRSLRWMPSLGLFTLLNWSGSDLPYFTSPDGMVWTTRAGKGFQMQSLDWFKELGIYVGVGTGGNMCYSSNCITWNDTNITIPSNVERMAYSDDLGCVCFGGVGLSTKPLISSFLTPKTSLSLLGASTYNTKSYISQKLGIKSIAASNGDHSWSNNPSGTNETELMRISTIGLGVGITPNFKLDINGKSRLDGNVGIGIMPNSTYQLMLSTDNAAKLSSSAWTVYSDIRLKENITLADTDKCYDNVKNLKLKKYTWKDSINSLESIEDRSKLGFIAQDVEKLFPKSVKQMTAHGLADCRTLDTEQIIHSLYGCVQKLIKKVEALEGIIESLEIEEEV